MGLVVRVGMILIATVLIVCGLFTPELTSSLVIPSAAVHRTSDHVERSRFLIDVESAPDSPENGDNADGPVDLYGNEVTDAVAKYKLDATGSLYELHSPQTELPHLGSPKS